MLGSSSPLLAAAAAVPPHVSSLAALHGAYLTVGGFSCSRWRLTWATPSRLSSRPSSSGSAGSMRLPLTAPGLRAAAGVASAQRQSAAARTAMAALSLRRGMLLLEGLQGRGRVGSGALSEVAPQGAAMRLPVRLQAGQLHACTLQGLRARRRPPEGEQRTCRDWCGCCTLLRRGYKTENVLSESRSTQLSVGSSCRRAGRKPFSAVLQDCRAAPPGLCGWVEPA